jgi:hypothetical protein
MAGIDADGVRRIASATLVAGALDIAAAMAMAVGQGGTIGRMLRTVAIGAFPGARDWGAAGAAIGLLVHFAIMAAIAAVFVLAADRWALLKRQAVASGVAYGVLTWAAMNLVVLPLRWPTLFPDLRPAAVAVQLACHILLVGLPIALIARR